MAFFATIVLLSERIVEKIPVANVFRSSGRRVCENSSFSSCFCWCAAVPAYQRVPEVRTILVISLILTRGAETAIRIL